jgi:hypothetical protein
MTKVLLARLLNRRRAFREGNRDELKVQLKASIDA